MKIARYRLYIADVLNESLFVLLVFPVRLREAIETLHPLNEKPLPSDLNSGKRIYTRDQLVEIIIGTFFSHKIQLHLHNIYKNDNVVLLFLKLIVV